MQLMQHGRRIIDYLPSLNGNMQLGEDCNYHHTHGEDHILGIVGDVSLLTLNQCGEITLMMEEYIRLRLHHIGLMIMVYIVWLEMLLNGPVMHLMNLLIVLFMI